MEHEEKFFSDSGKKIEEYVKDRILLIKIQVAEKISKMAGLIFSGLIIALLGFFVLLFISFMAGYFFAELTHSFYIGFGIIAALYLILLLVVVKLRKKLIGKLVTDAVIKVFFEKNDNDDNEQAF